MPISKLEKKIADRLREQITKYGILKNMLLGKLF